MKKLLLLILCCIVFYSCDIIEPSSILRGLKIAPTSSATKKINDSMYVFYIDTAQWQTFERIEANTFQQENTIKITWDAYSNKKAYYWYSGIKFEAPIINKSSYTDKNGVSSTMLSVYSQMLGDTVMVLCGYRWDNELHLDHKYFIILSKN